MYENNNLAVDYPDLSHLLRLFDFTVRADSSHAIPWGFHKMAPWVFVSDQHIPWPIDVNFCLIVSYSLSFDI